MYRQQKHHFENNDPRESVRDRIVSVSKPYVRPIVRGKEMKGVLFERKPLGELFVKPKRPMKNSDDGQLTLWENFFGQ